MIRLSLRWIVWLARHAVLRLRSWGAPSPRRRPVRPGGRICREIDLPWSYLGDRDAGEVLPATEYCTLLTEPILDTERIARDALRRETICQ